MNTAKVERAGGAVAISLAGSIDDDFEFPGGIEPGLPVKIDLKDIKSISSLGIRGWIDWITPISKANKIILVNCPKAIVLQLGMIDSFLPPTATVESFIVPFFCDACEVGQLKLFTVGADVTLKPDKAYQIVFDTKNGVACPECKNPMELDVSADKYFSFLKNLPR